MAEWFRKLKNLIKIDIDFSNLININITKSSSNNPDIYNHDEANKNLNIYLDKFSQDKKQELKDILKDYIQEGNKLLEKDTSKLLNNLYDYNKENPDKAILEFFKSIIPLRDYEALQSSLYLKNAFKSGQDVRKLKSDIRKRFYDRGNNIANLCTAGYFETFLIPLYNSSQEKFKEVYEIIVDKSILAVFVHGEMGEEEITSQIKNKLEISQRYGINFIHIHGIGSINITKIKECVEKQKQFFELFDKNIFQKENILVMELLLK